MRIVPAVGLGLFFVFVVGGGLTYLIMELIAKWRKDNPADYRNGLERVGPDYLKTESIKEKTAIVGGCIAVALVIILMIKVPREWTMLIWYGLTVIGILVGISTFFLFGSEFNSKAETKQRPKDAYTRRESERARPKYQAEHQANVNEAQRNQQELDTEREKHQAEYQARVYEVQKKQAEIKAVQDDLYSLFGIGDDQSLKRGELLAKVLNRFFKANDICVREAFELIEQEGQSTVEIVDGVIEMDGYLYFVEMKWWKELLGTVEISPHLVRIFNHGYPGGILMTNSKFTQPAITICREALSQKIVILCELEEIVTLLEWNSSLKDFLQAKINAAVVNKNPLFKPLSHP